MTIGIEPDLTLVIDMEPEAALARGLARNSGEDRFEDLGAGFQARLRAGFLALAAAHPERCRLIDGNREADAVARDIRAAVAAVLP
jgi:dTMP kinase